MLFTDNASGPGGGVTEGVRVWVGIKVEVGEAVSDGDGLGVLVRMRVEVEDGIMRGVSVASGEAVWELTILVSCEVVVFIMEGVTTEVQAFSNTVQNSKASINNRYTIEKCSFFMILLSAYFFEW